VTGAKQSQFFPTVSQNTELFLLPPPTCTETALDLGGPDPGSPTMFMCLAICAHGRNFVVKCGGDSLV